MKKRSIAMVLVVAFSCVFLLGGCAGIKDDTTRTKTEGTLTGAAVGAAAGAILGALLGGGRGAAIGAAAGAVVGGAGGYIYGSHVANEKKKYATMEDWVNASILEAQKRNRELWAYNQNLKKQLAALERETSRLKREYHAKKIKKQRLIAKKKEIDKLLEKTKRKLAAAKEELKAQQYVQNDVIKNGNKDLGHSLDGEIAKIKATIKELEKRTDELASLSASIAV